MLVSKMAFLSISCSHYGSFAYKMVFPLKGGGQSKMEQNGAVKIAAPAKMSLLFC